MSETRFTKDHEWVRLDGETVAVGITDHAQQALGDLVYVELPEPGRAVDVGEACAVVESVKAASDVFAPLAGTVTEVNAAVSDDPALVNREAEGGAWLFKLAIAGRSAFDALLDADAYQQHVDSQA